MFTESITLSLPHPQATMALGYALGQQLTAGTVLLLNGELGAGKTTLVQGLGQGLGITDTIASPTFALIDEYSEGRLPLYHIDLYRLSPLEVGDLHLELYWEGRDYPLGIVAIEWAERMLSLPPAFLGIDLQYQGEERVALCYQSQERFDWRSLQRNLAPDLNTMGL